MGRQVRHPANKDEYVVGTHGPLVGLALHEKEKSHTNQLEFEPQVYLVIVARLSAQPLTTMKSDSTTILGQRKLRNDQFSDESLILFGVHPHRVTGRCARRSAHPANLSRPHPRRMVRCRWSPVLSTSAQQAQIQALIRESDWRQFEDLFVRILVITGRFSAIHRSQRVGGREVDVIAEEAPSLLNRPVRWAFEVSHHRTVDARKIEEEMMRLQALRGSLPIDHYALVTSGRLTPSAQARAAGSSIEVWDALHLAQLVPDNAVETLFLNHGVAPPIIPPPHTPKQLLIDRLASIPAGKDGNWLEYQVWVADALRYLFSPPLDPPQFETSDADRRNRRDIVMENACREGFWAHARNVYGAHYVVADAKNYSLPFGKQPVVDVCHYLKPYGVGMFGLLVSRHGPSASGRHAIREQWIAASKLIVGLSDADLYTMIELKASGGSAEDHLRTLIRDFRLSL